APQPRQHAAHEHHHRSLPRRDGERRLDVADQGLQETRPPHVITEEPRVQERDRDPRGCGAERGPHAIINHDRHDETTTDLRTHPQHTPCTTPPPSRPPPPPRRPPPPPAPAAVPTAAARSRAGAGRMPERPRRKRHPNDYGVSAAIRAAAAGIAAHTP